jgi:cyclic pyranopterin phosphate synthase
MSDLSHVDEAGSVRMVDVGAKPSQRRRAVARAVVHMAPETAGRRSWRGSWLPSELPS